MLKLKDINSENEATAEILNVSKLQSLEVLKLCTFYQRVAPALTNRQPQGYYSPHMLVPLSRNPQPQRQKTNIHRHSQSSKHNGSTHRASKLCRQPSGHSTSIVNRALSNMPSSSRPLHKYLPSFFRDVQA